MNKGGITMSRKDAREAAFKILYQVDIQKCDISEILNTYYTENVVTDEDKKYIDEVTTGAFTNLNVIDETIIKGLKSWTLNRISKVDKAILRLAVYEIFYREDIPERVSIYEAVELVKKFDSPKAGGFVNGILRGIIRKNEESEENN